MARAGRLGKLQLRIARHGGKRVVGWWMDIFEMRLVSASWDLAEFGNIQFLLAFMNFRLFDWVLEHRYLSSEQVVNK